MVVNSWNEWDPLKEIIVGDVDYSCAPELEVPVFVKTKFMSSPFTPGPHSIEDINKANEAVDRFIAVLHESGVKVRRPDKTRFDTSVSTPHWSIAHQNACSCPRDVITVLGNEILEAPMSWRSRFFEYTPYRTLINKYFYEDPLCKWSAAPKPLMTSKLYRSDFQSLNMEERACAVNNQIFTNTEHEPVFDAADIVRFGKDLFVQHGFTTNRKGIDWISRHTEGRFRVHALEFQNNVSPVHTDALFLPLRPGLVLCCPERNNAIYCGGASRLRHWADQAKALALSLVHGRSRWRRAALARALKAVRREQVAPPVAPHAREPAVREDDLAARCADDAVFASYSSRTPAPSDSSSSVCSSTSRRASATHSKSMPPQHTQ